MFYWKTSSLAKQIKEGKIRESDRKNYYLATSILVSILMYLAMGEGTSDYIATLVECTVLILIVVFGINITFNTNKGNEGEDYVARVTMLSLPILIKLFVFAFIAALLFGIVIGATGDNIEIASGQWSMTIIALVTQVLFFWRINVHLEYINAGAGIVEQENAIQDE